MYRNYYLLFPFVVHPDHASRAGQWRVVGLFKTLQEAIDTAQPMLGPAWAYMEHGVFECFYEGKTYRVMLAQCARD